MRLLRLVRSRPAVCRRLPVLLTLAAWTGFAVSHLTFPGVSAATLRPTFVGEAETSWNSSTSPKTTASFNVLAGDVLIAYALQQNSSGTLAVSGGSLPWTPVQTIDVGGFGEARIWSAVVDVNKAMTATFSSSSGFFGANVLIFRDTDGVGASAQAHAAGGTPVVNLTTTQANSAIVVVNVDGAAVNGSSRVWRTNGGPFTEQSYFRNSSRYTVYGGFHPDAGAVGTYAVGLSAPSGQTYSVIGVEVKGKTSGPPDTASPTVSMTAPVAGAVSGTVNVSADAADDVAVAGVQFLLDGVNLGTEDTSSPYSISWDTTSITNGNHQVSARARDAAGNTAVSTPVPVTVSNISLVAAFGFTENAGATAVDSSGAGNTGTLANGTRWSVSGKYGSALLFDGVDDVLNVADSNSLDVTNRMTLEAWVFPTALSGYKTVIKKDNGTSNLAFALSANNNSSSSANQPPTSRITIGTTTRTVTGTSKLPLNTWTHLASTYDGASLRLYVNGVNVASLSTTGNIVTTANTLRIGGNPTAGGEYFTGTIDELRIYNRALSAVEIQADMSAPIAIDTTAPTVAMSAPVDGSTVSGSSVAVSATASDDNVVAGVQFKLDGVNLGAEDTTSPYSVTWNTMTASNGPHSLSAVARDGSGNTTAASNVTVTVGNPPVISAVTPSSITEASAQVNWTTNIPADSLVNYGPTSSYGLSTTLDTAFVTSHSQSLTGLSSGTVYHYQVVSRDSTGLMTASTDGTFRTLDYDVTPPTAVMTAPTAGANLSGTVAVSADASDNIGVAGVQFKLDGANLGLEDLTSPYSATWNTGAAANGPHTLSAVVRDAAGNIGTAASLDVVVDNSGVTLPVISEVSNSHITSTGATITWLTDLQADTQVEYGLTTNYGSLSPLNTALVTSHSQALTGLIANSTYHYRVRSKDAAGNLGVSSDRTLATPATQAPLLRYHGVVTDASGKLMPWYSPDASFAYDSYLRKLWKWLPTVPNGPNSTLPMYYLYNGFFPGSPIQPDTWENDWGERIPNFFEFGRLFYAYSGDRGPLDISRAMLDYALLHGMTPASYNWPSLAFGAVDAGATEINGDNVAWNADDVLLDLAADMGMSFYKAYLIYGDQRYRTAAIGTADTMASKIQPGNATDSPWPYVVNARTGATSARYAANWAGALTLFDLLIENNEPNSILYGTARQTLKNWILQYPMQNGNWVDGHSDNKVTDTTNWSNTSKSNLSLYMLDNPSWDPNFTTDLPQLLGWTETYFVNAASSDGLPGVYLGAYIPFEQFVYKYRMGYQTSRQAAEYAGWYEVTGDPVYKDRAFRGFNYSTYMMKDSGESSDGPTDTVGFWWGDDYGEGPRMFFYGFRAVPEWAPRGENHILYSNTTLKDILYASNSVGYSPTNAAGTEYLKTAFVPGRVTIGGVSIEQRSDLNAEGFVVADLGNGDYSVKIRRDRAGDVLVTNVIDTEVPTAPSNLATTGGLGTTSSSWTASTDNVGVVRYNVYRSISPDFVPDLSSRIGQPTVASFNDSGLAAGTYYYKVTAQDAAGNVSTSSNEASATVVADVTPPAVNVTAPAEGSTVAGNVTVAATASDDVGVVGVQFVLDGVNLGTEDASAPYSLPWATGGTSNGLHTLTARARDAAGNVTTSNPVSVTVFNYPATLAIHSSSPARVQGLTPITTAAFSPPDSALLLVLISADAATGVAPAMTISNNGTALSWTLIQQRSIADAGGLDGSAAAYYAVLPTGRTGMTITAAMTNQSNRLSMKVYVVTGHDPAAPIGASGEGSSTTNNITPTIYTSTAAGSVGFAVASDWTAPGTPLSTDEEDAFFLSGFVSGLSAYKAAPTTAAGTAVSMNFDASGTAAVKWNWVGFEVKRRPF